MYGYKYNTIIYSWENIYDNANFKMWSLRVCFQLLSILRLGVEVEIFLLTSNICVGVVALAHPLGVFFNVFYSFIVEIGVNYAIVSDT
jgi:hypothetical protein